jgi:hypothetical protein
LLGGQAQQSAARGQIQTKPFFTMSMSDRHATYRGETQIGSAGQIPVLHNGVLARSGWWRQTGSNRRPEACKATALPTELCPQLDLSTSADAPWRYPNMVGLGRLELPTSRLSSARSNQLSYRPNSASAPLCDLKERETKTAVSRKWTVTFGPYIQMTLR